MNRSNYFSVVCAVLFMGMFDGCTKYPAYEITDEFFVNKSSLVMYTSDKEQISVSPADGSYTWSVNNESVAKVTPTGPTALVEALAPGIADVVISNGKAQTLVQLNVSSPTANVVIIGEGNDLQIAAQTSNDRVSFVRVYWNNNRDSTDIEVNFQAGVFVQDIVYTGADYIFNVVSFDRSGNRSLVTEITKTTFQHRTLMVQRSTDNILFVQWGQSAPSVARCILSYIDTNGDAKTREVLPDEMSTVISDYASGLTLNTVFELDFIHLDPVFVETKFKARGSVIAWSDAYTGGGNDAGGVETLFDNNYGQPSWHSGRGGNYDASSFPYWFVVDLGSPKTVTKIITQFHATNRIAMMRCYISNSNSIATQGTGNSAITNPEAWGTKISDTEEWNGAISTVIPNATAGRYLLLYLYGNGFDYPHVNICEIDMYVY